MRILPAAVQHSELFAELEAGRTIEQVGDHLMRGNMIVEHTIDGLTDGHIHAQMLRQFVHFAHRIHAFGDMT